MIFSSLFKPKWQHRNPRIRRQALEQLDPRQAATREIFLGALHSDTDPVIRQWLVRHVDDFVVLQRIAQTDSDAMVREHALQRCRRVLAGQDGALDLTQRKQLLLSNIDAKTLEYVARHGVESELRLAMLLQVNRDALYGDAAIDDADAELRFQSAQRIVQRSTLERVAKAVKGKDKRVRNEVQARLDALDEAALRPAQLYQELKQICVKLTSLPVLLQSRPDVVDQITEDAQRFAAQWRVKLDEWRKFGFNDEEQLQARYAQAESALAATLTAAKAQHIQLKEHAAALATLQQQQQALCEEMERVLANRTSESTQDEATAIADRVSDLERQWAALPVIHDSHDSQHPHMQQSSRRFVAAARAIKKQLTESRSQAAQRESTAAWLARASALAQSSLAVEEIEDLLRQAKEFTVGGQQDGAEFAKQIAEVQNALRQQLDELAEQVQKASTEFKDRVPEFIALVESGQTKPAAAAAHRLQSLLRVLPDDAIERLRKQKLFRSFQAAKAKLDELRDWQGFAATPLRERLCEEVAVLADEIEAKKNDPEFSLVDAAERVQEARDRWQRIGAGEPEQTQVLWEKFNELCNRAYAPCQEYFAQQAAERATNLAARESVCDRLESFCREAIKERDPQQIEWSTVEKTLRAAQDEWRACGPVARKHHKAINERFRLAQAGLRRAIDEERERNVTNKQSLIKRAENIVAQVSDAATPLPMDTAVEQVKALQQEWKTIGRGRSDKEMWQQFAATCDAVFSHRQAQFEFQAQARRSNLVQRQSVCQMLENLAQLSGDELGDARVRAQQIKQEWNNLGPVPKDDAREIERRFRAACDAIEHAHQQASKNAEQVRLGRIVNFAAECTALEQCLDRVNAASMSAEDFITSAKRVVDALGEIRQLAHPAERGIVARGEWLAEASQALQGTDAARRSQVLAQREQARARAAATKDQLCLRAEILAGIESPPEAKAARLEMQVAQLADRMQGAALRNTGGSERAGGEPQQILSTWYELASAAAAQEEALSARFARAKAQFR